MKNFKNQFQILLTLVVMPQVLLASDNAIPLDFILKKQLPHFLVFAGVICFLIVKKVGPILKQKREQFTAHLKKAEESKAKAEALKKNIEDQISQLESSKQKTLEQAKVEAQNMKTKILSEAKAMTSRLESDVQTTLQYELERAKQELEVSLLNTSIQSAKNDLQKKAGTSELGKLQASFTEKIQVVR